MAGKCHGSYQHEFDPTLGGSGKQEGLACSAPWGHKESDSTKRLNNKITGSQGVLKHCMEEINKSLLFKN